MKKLIQIPLLLLVTLLSFYGCIKDPDMNSTIGNSNGNGNNTGGGNSGNGNSGGSIPGSNLSQDCSGYWVCMNIPSAQSIYYTGALNLFQAYGASAATNHKVYFAGGTDDFSVYGGSYSSGIEYNPDSNVFRSFNLSVPRSFLAGATAGNKILFAGGEDLSYYLHYPVYNTVDIYDEQSLTQTVAALSEARSHLASVSSGAHAFFIGGKTKTGFSDKMDIYNSADNSWKSLTLPRQRGYAEAAVIENRIYIAGGQNSSGNLRSIDIYDVQSGQWSSLEAPHEHPFASVVAVNNKLIVAGGDGVSNKYADIYNTSTNQWTSVNLSDTRFNMTVAVVNNKAVFLSGAFSFNGYYFSNESGDIDMYDDTTGSWSVGSISPAARGMMAASVGSKIIYVGFMSASFGTANTMVILTL